MRDGLRDVWSVPVEEASRLGEDFDGHVSTWNMVRCWLNLKAGRLKRPKTIRNMYVALTGSCSVTPGPRACQSRYASLRESLENFLLQ